MSENTDKQTELKKKSCLDIEAAKKLVKIQQSASSRGIDFAMTFSEVKRLLAVEKCFFSGVKLNNIDDSAKQRTFDRVENDKGYVNGNVVACSKEFNQIKGNLTIDQVKILVRGFKKKKVW